MLENFIWKLEIIMRNSFRSGGGGTSVMAWQSQCVSESVATITTGSNVEEKQRKKWWETVCHYEQYALQLTVRLPSNYEGLALTGTPRQHFTSPVSSPKVCHNS